MEGELEVKMLRERWDANIRIRGIKERKRQNQRERGRRVGAKRRGEVFCHVLSV